MLAGTEACKNCGSYSEAIQQPVISQRAEGICQNNWWGYEIIEDDEE